MPVLLHLHPPKHGSSKPTNCGFATALALAVATLLPGQEGAPPPAQGQAAAPGSAATPGGAELPPGVLARIDGKDITVDAYAEYLLASLGTSRLGEYIDRLLIEQEAARRGIEVAPEEVEALVADRTRRDIEALYQGNRDRYIEALEAQGTTLEDREARLRQELYYDRLLDRLVIDAREVGEDDVRAEFERVHGPGGERRQLRHILVSTRPRIGPGGERLERSDAEARERAGRILEEVRAGADFVEQVKKYSDDTLTRRNEGRIAAYRPGVHGAELDAAVAGLGEGKTLSDVVRSPRGYHIIQWIGTETTRFEDLRETIAQELRNRPATTEEKDTLILELRKKAQITR